MKRKHVSLTYTRREMKKKGEKSIFEIPDGTETCDQIVHVERNRTKKKRTGSISMLIMAYLSISFVDSLFGAPSEVPLSIQHRKLYDL